MQTELTGAAIAFVCAMLATPAGLTGAFLLVPIQLTMLGVPAAKVPATNLIFNVISAPGATVRHWRGKNIDFELVRWLTLGTVPGVVVGAVLRAEVFTEPDVFKAVVAIVLGVLGLWILAGPRPAEDARGSLTHPQIVAIAFAAGIVGGVYGVGGGVFTAPVLVLLGVSVASFAPATILVTLISSVVGIAAFVLLSSPSFPSHPDIGLGVALGIGGVAGSWTGAKIAPRMPELLLRRGIGVAALLLAARVLY